MCLLGVWLLGIRSLSCGHCALETGPACKQLAPVVGRLFPFYDFCGSGIKAIFEGLFFKGKEKDPSPHGAEQIPSGSFGRVTHCKTCESAIIWIIL